MSTRKRPAPQEDRPIPNGDTAKSSIRCTRCRPDVGTMAGESQQVNWWEVHEFVLPYLAAAGAWPMAGTPAWCHLPDDDDRKLAALLDAARHWALRVDTCQAERAQASKDIASAADWPAIASEIRKLRAAEAAGARVPRRAS